MEVRWLRRDGKLAEEPSRTCRMGRGLAEDAAPGEQEDEAAFFMDSQQGLVGAGSPLA